MLCTRREHYIDSAVRQHRSAVRGGVDGGLFWAQHPDHERAVGAYTVKAELLDSIGDPLTSVVMVANPVIVNEGLTSGLILDFPVGSFVQPGITTGRLGVSWTIASDADPTQCANNGASSIELQFTDTIGTPIGAATSAVCTAFTTTIDGIAPSTYALTVTMLDVNGAAVTTPFSIPDLTITAGATTSQPVDFPLNSFLQ